MRSSTRDRLKVDLANLLATLQDIETGRIKLPPRELKLLSANVDKRVSEIKMKLDDAGLEQSASS